MLVNIFEELDPKNAVSVHAGFSLIELIIVILLIGILSVMVMPRDTMRITNLGYEARHLFNDVRYVQALSEFSGQRYRWVKLSSSSYQITNESGSPIVLPSGGTQYTFGSGITMGSLSNLPNSLVAFDTQGTPYVDSALPGTPLAALGQIPLTGSGQTFTVTITPQTGYTQLQ